MGSEPARRPLLRIVRGEPDDTELAALTAVVAARAAAAARARRAAHTPPAASRWGDLAGILRVPPRPGPGAWRSAGSR
jgi:hypothetical protein